MTYDPITDGVKVNVIDGADSLGDKLDALKVSIDLLIIAVNANTAKMP